MGALNTSDASVGGEGRSVSGPDSGDASNRQGTAGRSSSGKAIRVGDELVRLAERHAQVAHRSPPKQIEYWAHLGRLFEMSLSSSDLHALLSDQKFIAEVRLASGEVPSVDTVLEELNADRTSGRLAASLSDAQDVFDLADDGRSVRRTDASGNVALGAFFEGKFVEGRDEHAG